MKRLFLTLIIFCMAISSWAQDINEITNLIPAETLSYARAIKIQNTSNKYFFTLFESKNHNFTYGRKGIHGYIFKEAEGKYKLDGMIPANMFFSELEAKIKRNGEIIRTSFFEEYENSNLNRQLDSFKMKDCLVFAADIDNDGNDELLGFGDAEINSPKGFIILKLIDERWTCVYSESYFGFYDWNESFYKGYGISESALDSEWFTAKKFPYDFVEYKGKTGLRIICHDMPKDDPDHYHAQFWTYSENIHKYELQEEIWENENSTPSDGLIFADARENIFINN